MKNAPLEIAQATIHPGETVTLALPLPELFSCAPLHMPIKVMHGRQKGPCLLVTAAMHGDEMNGTEIINRLLSRPSLKRLRGTIIAVPVVNVYGLINRSRFLPDGGSLDDCFPGSEHGHHGARIAHLFTQMLFPLADVCVDLQTGDRNFNNFPQTFVDVSNEPVLDLAEKFGAPIITDFDKAPGRFSTWACEQGKPTLVYEAGEAMRFDEYAIKTGVKGLMNLLRALGMVTKSASDRKQTPTYIADEQLVVRANTSGVVHTTQVLGSHVRKGDVIGVISDPFGVRESVDIKCPVDAAIVAMNDLPLIQEGEAVFHLATFPRLRHVSEQLTDISEQYTTTPEQGGA